MKKVLFVTYGGGHMKIIEPIVKELERNYDNIELKVLALTSSYKYLLQNFNKDIVKNLLEYSFLFDDVIDEVLKYGLEFLYDNYTKNALVTKEETIFYIGLSFYDLVQREGKNEAYKLYEIKKRQAFLPILIIKKILEYENIDIVVSTTSPRFEQASFIAGNKLGIQTLEILDLFAEIYPLPEANHIVVMNEFVKRSLIQQNLKNKNYYVLGQPAIETTVKNVKKINKDSVYSKLNINKDKKTLLIATQRLSIVDKNLQIIKSLDYELVYDKLFEILDFIHKQYNINIIVRLHPNESISNYKKYFQKYDYLLYTNEIVNLEECISVADILLTKTSTVAIEAIAAHKSVFTYKHKYDDYYSVPAFQHPPFIFSNGFEELKKNLCNYLNDPKKLDTNFNFLPNNSAKNIAKLIKEL